MKQKLLLLALLCGAMMMATSAKAQDDYYYESISNPSKTIHFLIAVYVTKNDFFTRDDGTGYTKNPYGGH